MSELKEATPKTIKIPGPDHPITIECYRDRILVKVAGRIVADTRDALTLHEASYAPVQYIPRKDVDVTSQAAMIGCIDDFALILIGILASLPLLLLVRVPRREPAAAPPESRRQLSSAREALGIRFRRTLADKNHGRTVGLRQPRVPI